ncbi:hypothetical protein Y1U_C0823 [Streptococcus thermophilus MN-ZLW-002]|nr:hypothetical protein Y1U_C0823 [Streptococcus thermophilus MN-ZLW-002]
MLRDFGGSFLRRHDAPHFIKCIHVERQRIQLAFVVGHGGVGEAVELSKLCNVVPDLFVVSVENMRSIFMDIDTLNVFGIDISRNVRTLIYY